MLSTSALIDRLKSIFARHGILEIVKSDNGTNYSSAEFAKSVLQPTQSLMVQRKRQSKPLRQPRRRPNGIARIPILR